MYILFIYIYINIRLEFTARLSAARGHKATVHRAVVCRMRCMYKYNKEIITIMIYYNTNSNSSSIVIMTTYNITLGITIIYMCEIKHIRV